MEPRLASHLSRLRLACAAIAASTLVYGLLVAFLPAPAIPRIAQAGPALLLLALVSVLNLVTLTPVHRAMLAGPLRVFAVSREIAPLLAAHFTAHLVLFARLEAIALFGLGLYLFTGRADWFWGFVLVAVAGMLVLWPSQRRTAEALGLPSSVS